MSTTGTGQMDMTWAEVCARRLARHGLAEPVAAWTISGTGRDHVRGARPGHVGRRAVHWLTHD
jgi:hypothetical protein